jgi:hypothetical protein
MKKYLVSFLFAGVVVAGVTGCLKDEGFEDQQYGTVVSEQKGISFPQSTVSPISVALNSVDTVQRISTAVNLESSGPAREDITVSLTVNPTLATDAGLEPLPAGSFIVPATVTIPAGQRFVDVVITIPNASILNPVRKYGLGLTISGVSNGYTIASNMKNVVFSFNIKNKYDGIYRLQAYANLGSNTSAPYLVSTNCAYGLTLTTTGPSSVRMSSQPLWRGNAFYAGFCNVNFDFTMNPTTDKVTNVTSWATTGCGGAGIGVNFPGPGAAYDSRFDPQTKTLYVKMGLNNNPAWIVIDTLIYCGPRP